MRTAMGVRGPMNDLRQPHVNLPIGAESIRSAAASTTSDHGNMETQTISSLTLPENIATIDATLAEQLPVAVAQPTHVPAHWQNKISKSSTIPLPVLIKEKPTSSKYVIRT